jgi:hypothetical protein
VGKHLLQWQPEKLTKPIPEDLTQLSFPKRIVAANLYLLSSSIYWLDPNGILLAWTKNWLRLFLVLIIPVVLIYCLGSVAILGLAVLNDTLSILHGLLELFLQVVWQLLIICGIGAALSFFISKKH